MYKSFFFKKNFYTIIKYKRNKQMLYTELEILFFSYQGKEKIFLFLKIIKEGKRSVFFIIEKQISKINRNLKEKKLHNIGAK